MERSYLRDMTEKHEADEEMRRLSVAIWLSYEGRTVNALALGAEEGRDERRNASGSCK